MSTIIGRMTSRAHRVTALAAALAAASLLTPPSLAQNLGTIGTGVAGESTAKGPAGWKPPTGPAPRLPNGKPDFSGVWDHAYVPDMSASNARNPALQTGAGPLPYTPAGLANIKDYNPEKNGDYTGMCMPFGLMRSVNAPYPFQIMQSDKYVTLLFEQSNWFHIVPFRDQHSAEPNPTWFGESIARWEGDTLVIDTIGFNGFTRLDTRGNPHSDQLHLIQRLARTDAGRISYTVTVEDPVFYTRPWSNSRTFTLANTELIEYSCEENNRSLWEGRIKIWQVPGSEPLRGR
jgi:hypothetical protein